MNPTNPLESVYFISLPENFDLNSATFQIDKSIPLPVQKKDADETLKIEDITVAGTKITAKNHIAILRRIRYNSAKRRGSL